MLPSCHLDKLREDDLPHLVRLYTDPRVREFLGGPVDPVKARMKTEALFQERARCHVWAVRRTGDGEFLGAVYLDPHHDGEDMEVSYTLLPEHQGFGHAAAALEQVFRFASNDLMLVRVVAETQCKNGRSIRLLERVGMIPMRKVIRCDAEQVIYVADLQSSLRRGVC